MELANHLRMNDLPLTDIDYYNTWQSGLVHHEVHSLLRKLGIIADDLEKDTSVFISYTAK